MRGRDYYERIYRDYDRQNPQRKLALYRTTLIRHLGDAPGRSVLDVGCAFGLFLSVLPPGWQRYGIDSSSFAIGRARRRHSGIQFATATLETNPFQGPFDAVTSFDVIEHIHDLEHVAATIDSLLRPGGIFQFVVPAYDGPFGSLVYLLDRDPTHVHKKSRHFWLNWAGRHFQVVEWTGIYRFLFPSGWYMHLPARRLRALTPAILVVAQKRQQTYGGS